MSEQSEPRKLEMQHANRDIENLLRDAVPPVDHDAVETRDLWPVMLSRMNNEGVRGAAAVPWFDWALAGGLVAFAALAPRTIPVILYYL